MQRIYAVYCRDIPGGVTYDVYVTGKKRRYVGLTFDIMEGEANDAPKRVADYEASLKVAETS